MDDDLYLPEGAEEPHFTQFPNLFLDWVMPKVSNAEWKVLSYLCRLTWGFHRYDTPTPITLAQIERGTALSHGAVVKALRIFKERGFIEIEPHGSPEHGTEANTYRLRVHKGASPRKNSGAGSLSEHGGTPSAHRPPAPSGQPSSLYRKKERKDKRTSIPVQRNDQRAPSSSWDDRLCSGCGTNRCLPSCSAQECPDRRAPAGQQ